MEGGRKEGRGAERERERRGRKSERARENVNACRLPGIRPCAGQRLSTVCEWIIRTAKRGSRVG